MYRCKFFKRTFLLFQDNLYFSFLWIPAKISNSFTSGFKKFSSKNVFASKKEKLFRNSSRYTNSPRFQHYCWSISRYFKTLENGACLMLGKNQLVNHIKLHRKSYFKLPPFHYHISFQKVIGTLPGFTLLERHGIIGWKL